MTGELLLLVDDEPNIIELAQLYLEREGYQIISATDGTTALEAVEQHNPALVVLDVMLPELDGLEICRTLREQEKSRFIPVIILTAKSEENDIITGLEMGADD
ncbi:MAG: response regulator, partial [Anaerolineales bacterium]|nr:response regulator [Anaerolineales bacterium]